MSRIVDFFFYMSISHRGTLVKKNVLLMFFFKGQEIEGTHVNYHMNFLNILIDSKNTKKMGKGLGLNE